MPTVCNTCICGNLPSRIFIHAKHLDGDSNCGKASSKAKMLLKLEEGPTVKDTSRCSSLMVALVFCDYHKVVYNM